MAPRCRVVVLDDCLLIEELLVGLPAVRGQLHTTMFWYYLEAVAAGHVLGARVWLSRQTAAGALPRVLDQEGVAWQPVGLD